MASPSPGQRYHVVDGLRGVAVMGILLINISAFALPDAAYFNPIAYGGERAIDVIAWGVNLVLVDGKMRNLFSFLFGSGLLLVAERAQGGSAARAHFARLGWLLVFGLAHCYLLWSGDILSQYAVLGMAAWLLRRLQPRTLLLLATAALVVQLAIFAGFLWLLSEALTAAAVPGASAADVAAGRSALRTIGAEPQAIAAEVARYAQSSYADLVTYRVQRLTLAPLLQLGGTGAETMAMILLGMAGYKSGFVTGAWPPERYRRLARLFLIYGLIVMLALLWLCIATGYDARVTFGVVTAASLLARPFLMIAYAALLILWLTQPAGAIATWVAARVAAAGRMAFTNYLLTSLAMTSIFYGYGLGLFGRLGRADLFLVVIAWWALLLLWSRPWLRRFRYGPLEWLWRSLTRGVRQPMLVRPFEV